VPKQTTVACVHVFHIVARRPDNIPRAKGFKVWRSRPIRGQMIEPSKQAWLPLGSLLVREGLITHDQLEEALLMQQGTGRRLGELLVEWGWVTSRAICVALAEQYELEFVDIDQTEIDQQTARRLPKELARTHRALPLFRLPDGRLLVGVADPTDVGAAERLRVALGAIRLAVVDQIGLERAIHDTYSS
jgi:MSHA biogenesis protein MshE